MTADAPELPDRSGLQYQMVRYEDRMELLLAAADLLVGRAGGTTVAELAEVGLPGLLVPLPIAPRDHQTANAAALVRAGAAILVPDEELDGERVVRELQPLLDRARPPHGHGGCRPVARPSRRRRPGGRPRGGERPPCPILIPTRLDLPPSLSEPCVVHVVAIGGTGMSPIATVLAAMGHRVSGSDLRDSVVLDRLRSLGITATVGHDAGNVPDDVDFLAISTAVPDENPEVVEARRRGVPVVRRTTLLAAIAAERKALAVAGTHGKTTTSAMLALVLQAGGLEPSFIVGGRVSELGHGAAWTDGEWFVVEADESDGSGFAMPHTGAIVTNVEPDHLEYHGSVENLHAAFARFLAATTGPRVVCADDEVAARLGRDVGAVTYGTADDADVHMAEVRAGRDGIGFDVWRSGEHLGPVHVPLPGLHNARNACAALAMGLEIGVSFDDGVVGPGPRSAGSTGASSTGARSPGSRSSTTTPTCPPRSPPRWRPAATAVGGGSSPCSSPTATAVPQPCGRTSPMPSRGPTCWCSPTSTPRTRPRGPGSRASSSSMPCSTPTGASPWPTCRPSTTSSTTSAPACDRATCASRSGPAISPPCPTG